jgi:hypothetical protein
MSILPSIESLSLRLTTLRSQIAVLTERLALVESAQGRTKQKAGENEAKDIEAIIAGINTKNACGARITDEFTRKFPGHELLSARPRQGGNRGTHYDFEALIRTAAGAETWARIEHKGSYKYAAIGADDAPWSAGVQFYNGGCEKYSLAKKYARTWYDAYIATGALATEFGLMNPAPTYDDWFKSDCKAQDDPKTEFGKELKSVVRAAGGSLLEKRATVNTALTITEEDERVLKDEVRTIANQALNQKEYWLTIRGNLDGEFVCAWYPQFTITAIEEVVVTKNRDIELEFRCNDAFVFHGILRWGKGAGFSNLRLDLK